MWINLFGEKTLNIFVSHGNAHQSVTSACGYHSVSVQSPLLLFNGLMNKAYMVVRMEIFLGTAIWIPIHQGQTWQWPLPSAHFATDRNQCWAHWLTHIVEGTAFCSYWTRHLLWIGMTSLHWVLPPELPSIDLQWALFTIMVFLRALPQIKDSLQSKGNAAMGHAHGI